MGRPPCCDKVGVKKGPWTPEEDIVLVSYIQEHGPGNWRALPTNTGLMRCSKSCRLRWTNYLRPGIKRGNFTEQEEKLIIHLQALLGNRWAAMASYLPERTDNDIKNYWNTHLKKKLRRQQQQQLQMNELNEFSNSYEPSIIPKGQWERRVQTDMNMARQALTEALSLDSPEQLINPASSLGYSSATYASSTENISRLLEGWMKNSPKTAPTNSGGSTQHSYLNNMVYSDSASSEGTTATNTPTMAVAEVIAEARLFKGENKHCLGAQVVPLYSMVETWLLDENFTQGHENLIDMSLDDTTLMFSD